jgi:hypothetical protein
MELRAGNELHAMIERVHAIPRNSIGGMLDLSAYSKLANLHRPTDTHVLEEEIRRLHRSGHSEAFIAETLKVAPEMVARAIAEYPPQ